MVDELCRRRLISRVLLKQIAQKRRIINGFYKGLSICVRVRQIEELGHELEELKMN